MADFPLPAYELLPLQKYFIGSIQFSSGCPYQCEFCDIPALYGRNPRLKSPEQVIEELYVRTLCRKPTPAETKRLAAIVRRETGDPERVKALAVLQARVDTGYRRGEERLQQLREDLKKAPNNSREAAALNRQIANVEQQLDGLRKSYERNVPQMVYGDILWGLFNSTEFTFNH